MRNDKVVKLTPLELKELDEYPCSIPTGTTIGKRWKRNNSAYVALATCDKCGKKFRVDPSSYGVFRCPDCKGTLLVSKEPLPDEWWMGEYVPDPKGDPKMVGIRWRKIAVEWPGDSVYT